LRVPANGECIGWLKSPLSLCGHHHNVVNFYEISVWQLSHVFLIFPVNQCIQLLLLFFNDNVTFDENGKILYHDKSTFWELAYICRQMDNLKNKKK
jgi:hypothetical protein